MNQSNWMHGDKNKKQWGGEWVPHLELDPETPPLKIFT